MPTSSIGSAALRLAALLPLLPVVLGQSSPSGVAEERQIHWQRSLEDAVAIASAEHRPILVAVNMDGESASERIVKENYRDPAFVALTRKCVCVVASAFRHAPRDHDDLGRRIACPRLGEVTCGEHIALEPVLFDKYLGGERIAPRHALILPDGTKSFDLFLLFDLGDLDRSLAESLAAAPPATAANGARDHRARLAFETSLLGLRSEAERAEAVRTIASDGDAGSVEALRILISSDPPPSADLLQRIEGACRSRKIEAPAAAMLRDRIFGLGPWPGAAGLGDDEPLLGLLDRLDGSSAATRSLVAAYGLLGVHGQEPLATWLAKVRETPPAAATPKPPDDLPEADALEADLAQLDERLSEHADDPELLAAYGKTSLGLARRRLETGGSGAQLLLQDADHYLEKAARARPTDAPLLLLRARTNFLLARFEEQEKISEAALAVAKGDDRTEALRWLGDASARLLGARSGASADVEAAGIRRGARALEEVAASPAADETDWISLGSFLGALGMRREELAVYQLGAERLPASTPLRSALNGALWSGGRIDLSAPKAEWIAGVHPDSADCLWHAGYARVLEAEERRRAEQPDLALESYAKADAWFVKSAAAKPEYADSTTQYRALCALGRGFAHLLAGRRNEAARALADALAIRPAVATARDGLDREAVDLLDGALEWRAEGASPVDVHDLAERLERADPGNAFWLRSISDSELREALRADGRGEVVEGDRYLRVSIDVARRALAVSDDPDSRRALAQPLTILAERLLERGDPEQARPLLAEAAPLQDEPPPEPAADLAALAAKLREKLGAARPRFRPGR